MELLPSEQPPCDEKDKGLHEALIIVYERTGKEMTVVSIIIEVLKCIRNESTMVHRN